MAVQTDFPVMVYKPGDALLWDGEGFDFLIAENADALDAAIADGWSFDKPSSEVPETPRRGRHRRAES